MTIKTKFSIGDKVLFDNNRVGEIVGFEVLNVLIEHKGKYLQGAYPDDEDNTNIRYQIKPIDGGERLYGSMRLEKTLKPLQ